ncbi:hypothetical protein [Xanthomonas arboricola]|uniref:hypothetical protein n=1 Tax=Xanthomonas arboricola TaxID=56448 RepID=UPI0011B0AA01|nr:hypothetical protein [Xanthomonas arboricola]CAG2088063.1 hypothetical protein XCY_001571 [Xanthomonas arboricola pv. juglandis]
MSDEANNTLSELKNELKGAINVRLRSPIAGLFALSWLLINHRVLFVLFSNLKPGKRFDFIDDEIYGMPGAWISMNLIFPLISTAFFLLVMPWISALVHRWNLWHQRRQRDLELRSDGLMLLTEEKSRELRASLSTRDKVIAELQREILDLAAKNSRYVSMNFVLNNISSEEVTGALRTYLLLHSFSVELVERAFVRQFHSFDDDGYVRTEWKQGSDQFTPDRWSLEGARLSLYVRGSIYLSAELNGKTGFFDTTLNGQTYEMVPIKRR